MSETVSEGVWYRNKWLYLRDLILRRVIWIRWRWHSWGRAGSTPTGERYEHGGYHTLVNQYHRRYCWRFCRLLHFNGLYLGTLIRGIPLTTDLLLRCRINKDEIFTNSLVNRRIR